MADDDKTAEALTSSTSGPTKPKEEHPPEPSRKPLEASPAAAFSDVKSEKESDSGQAPGAALSDQTKPHAPSPAPGHGSEWTVSDERGPLGRAEEEEGLGRTPAETDRVLSNEAAAVGTGGKTPAGEANVPPVDAAPAQAWPANGGSVSSNAFSTAGISSVGAAERKRSLWPVAAALILGAVIGAGSAAFVYRGYADDSQPDPQVASLTTRIESLEKRPDPQAAVAVLKSSVTALDGQVAALRNGAGNQGAAPREGAPSAAPAVDLEPLNQKIAALQAGLDSLKTGGADTKALQEKVAALEGALAGMKSEADRAEAGVSTVETRQKEIAGKVTAPALAVVADSLVQQIDHGQPYVAQVDALVALGADPVKVAVLRQNAESGVPSARVLATKFEPLALPIAATANKAPANAGFVDRLKSGMFSLVSVRRADDTSGSDLPSRVARIKMALAHDDVAGALEAWNALPPDARSKADAWGALAKSHADAMSAARALQHDSIVALSTKKS